MATVSETTSASTRRAPTDNPGKSAPPIASPLTSEMLARFESRAATYDREGRFFDQDFEELQAAGYLRLPIPQELGGAGFSLAQMAREQRRLGYYAPATALAVNMHLYWVGLAADLWRKGDTSLEWLLRDAAAGEIFAAGHAESGNDVPLDHKGGTRRGWLSLLRTEAIRQLVPCLDALRYSRYGFDRSVAAKDCARLHDERQCRLLHSGDLGCSGYACYP